MSVDQFIQLMVEDPELRQRLVDAGSNDERAAMVAGHGIEAPDRGSGDSESRRAAGDARCRRWRDREGDDLVTGARCSRGHRSRGCGYCVNSDGVGVVAVTDVIGQEKRERGRA